MSKKKIFDNAKVTKLMEEYAHHKKDVKLRDRIIRLTMPLISAAISKKRYYRNRDDLRQECVVKLLYALPKYDPSRGKAFAFLWTTICNTCNTQDQRLTRNDLSLSSDEDVMKEAETNGHEAFDTPENRHILNTISASITTAFDSFDVLDENRKLHKRACNKIKKFIVNGELFYNRDLVIRKLRKLGLDRKVVQFYVDRSLVLVRQRLLEAKDNVLALSVRKTGTTVSSDTNSGAL